MARINLPTRLAFYGIAAKWRIETHNSVSFALAETDNLPGKTPLDVWKLRAAFFTLRETNDALLVFLNETGTWSNETRIVHHQSVRHIEEYPFRMEAVSEIWAYRDRLRRALLNKTAFRESFEAKNSELQVRFKFTATAVEGIIEGCDTSQALLASVLIDAARGLRFKMCARKDCDELFQLKSQHKRKFCSQECGHLVSVRNKRDKERKAKQKARRKSLRSKTHGL